MIREVHTRTTALFPASRKVESRQLYRRFLRTRRTMRAPSFDAFLDFMLELERLGLVRSSVGQGGVWYELLEEHTTNQRSLFPA